MKAHTGRVNAVRWIGENTIASISDDKSLVVWQIKAGADPKKQGSYEVLQQEEGAHPAAINYLSVLRISDSEQYILTMCMGGSLKLWAKRETKFEIIGEILFGKNLQEAFDLTLIGQKYLLLVVGGYDRQIHCYTCPRAQHIVAETHKVSKHFTYKFSLTGHMDSLKDFAFTGSHSLQLPNQVQYLASGSQDNNIRIWKLQPFANITNQPDDDLEQIEQAADNFEQYQSKTSYVLDLKDQDEEVFNLALESVLVQHQNSISSVCWVPNDNVYSRQVGAQTYQVNSEHEICLLSCSFDFTVCLWEIQEDVGHHWNVVSTLGAMTGNKHAYFGAQFLDSHLNKGERSLLAYTYGGAVHIWSREISEANDKPWKANVTIKGHFNEVTDLDWDPTTKTCLVSCSSDQTTRLQVCHNQNYFEISRP